MSYLRANFPLKHQAEKPKNITDFEREALASLGGSIVIFMKAKGTTDPFLA